MVVSGARVSLLAIIAAFFVLACLLRLLMGANAAIAALPDAAEHAVTNDDASCSPEQMPSALAQALLARESAVIQQEQELQEQLETIESAKVRLAEQLGKLEAANSALEATIAIAAKASENDLEQLTAVYEAMKPAEASELFSEMPPDFASGFLGRMSPVAAAGIMAGLTPDAAYAISAHLAGRNALAPTE